MKKLIFLFAFLIFNIFYSQNKNYLSIKFDEKYFLSNFLKNRTTNAFVLNIVNKADSISIIKKQADYVILLDSLLKKNIVLSDYELNLMKKDERKEFDSLKIEIENGNFLNLMKKAVQVNFDSTFIEDLLEKKGFKNYKVQQPDYNKFFLSFSDQENLEKARVFLMTSRLSFHESLDDAEVENIQNCLLKENEILVKNFSLKVDNKILLISKNNINAYKNSKCFDSEKTFVLINNGKDFDVYSKLYFVKKSGKMENSLVNSIRGVDIDFKQNEDSYNDNLFYLSAFLDEFGKNYLSDISVNNIGGKIFIGNNSKFISFLNIKEKMINGLFISGNLFEENWQDLYNLVKFEVFRNSITIKK